MSDPYKILGISRGDSFNEVQDAYLRRVDSAKQKESMAEEEKRQAKEAFEAIVSADYPDRESEIGDFKQEENDPSEQKRKDPFSSSGVFPIWARPWPVFLQTALALLLGGFLGLLYIIVTGLGIDLETANIESTSEGDLFVPQLLTGLAFLLVPIWYVYKRVDSIKQTFYDLGFRKFAPLKSLGWAVLAFAVYLAFAAIYSNVFGEAEQDLSLDVLGPLWAQFFLIVIVAPITEEVCFRGMLFRGLLAKLSLPLAVVSQSFIFAVLHLATGPSAVPIIFVLGAFFALLYYKTKSLWVPILAHVANNGAVFLAISSTS